FWGEVIVACGRELMFFMLICLLPITYYLLPIAYCLLPIAYCLWLWLITRSRCGLEFGLGCWPARLRCEALPVLLVASESAKFSYPEAKLGFTG
ncbi:hypothetical protein QWA_17935, partial [Alcaligenes faecalis subsp. faecalis NCIB 8687]